MTQADSTGSGERDAEIVRDSLEAVGNPELYHRGRDALDRLLAEKAMLREALWRYREEIGHIQVLDTGCITGCPGCLADAALSSARADSEGAGE